MSQKDIYEKLLIEYNDVFADIVNVLLFDGREIINPNSLKAIPRSSQYKADDDILHEQERDISKLWENIGFNIALFGIENQTAIDRDMAIRVISYDGASYRSQLFADIKDKRYPVVTLVLYFGMRPWNAPRNLIEALDIPELLKPYVSNYKINLFEISYLTNKQLGKFKSDFGILADFFVNKRQDKNYRPKDMRKFNHVDAMLKFLAVMTQDNRYNIDIPNEQKEGLTMCSVLDRVEQEGIEKGIEQGLQQGEKIGQKKIVLNMLKTGFSDEQIMLACDISKDMLNEIRG